MTTVDPQSQLTRSGRGDGPLEQPARPRTYPALAVGLIAGSLIVYLLAGPSSGSGISSTISSLWDSLIAVVIGLCILYGAWCLFWPIVRNAILMVIGWIIILAIGVYTFLKYVGY
ncbi:hypothetical protein [Microvirga tunisiensis]|uniref:Uncharacterized protein n=1 Tax=Microvirga tunisiensis TaxID=2108360 RepID=A0A5N7MAW3_9HYPH|nr:hypothetical protein [Microvirga tunisiensis]MPR06276.1 hypothetical protein [Microvirga tunisiensis]MPR24062.1 hypothetical protein [Microvirga tunisiensis]